MENFEIIYLLSAAINGIFKIAIIIACLLIFLKTKNMASILMLVGSFLSILFSVGGFIWTTVAARNSPEALIQSNVTISVLNQIPIILFAVGLFLFALSYKKTTSHKKLEE